MGLAQINTSWVQHFLRYGIRLEHLLYDTCTNLQASAYILKSNANKFNGDWFKAIIAYNIGPANWTASRYAIGRNYADNVVKSWWGFQNWVEVNGSPVPAGANPSKELDPRVFVPEAVSK